MLKIVEVKETLEDTLVDFKLVDGKYKMENVELKLLGMWEKREFGDGLIFPFFSKLDTQNRFIFLYSIFFILLKFKKGKMSPSPISLFS